MHKDEGLFLPDGLAALEAEIARDEKALSELRKGRENMLREALVECRSCNAFHRVRNLTYIQTHWYTPPRGCTEGDYWNCGEGLFYCPACGERNRLYNRKEVEKLKRYFGAVEDTYDR